MIEKCNFVSLKLYISDREQFCTFCSLYDQLFFCQFGFMEPIKQTVENDHDCCLLNQPHGGVKLSAVGSYVNVMLREN